jgi:hypothetical protein
MNDPGNSGKKNLHETNQLRTGKMKNNTLYM